MDNPKKILIWGIISVAIIGVIASANTILDRFTSNNGLAIQSNVQRAVNSNSDLSSSSIEQFKNQFCGVDSSLNSNNYVTEYKLPHTCEMPLGITVDSQAGKIWYVSTKEGTLGSYNLISKRFDKEISIPIWNVRKNPIDFSNVWSVKVNSIGGSVWFTDEKQNAIWKYSKSDGFNMYKVPDSSPAFGTSSPVSLGFDSRGNVYFVGIHSAVLWFGNSTLMKNNTSNGITKIPMPMNNFNGIDSKQISVGSMTLDNRRNVIWISLSALESEGEILRYNITSRTFDTFILPEQLSLPVGLAVDENGNLWATDHGTSIFYMLNIKNHNITMFATSKASPRIYGLNDSGTLPGDANTLPYWMEKDAVDGSLWFNEHQGNKIARFDPMNNILYEYWIPTQNKLWGDCPPTSKTCGIANVLQFSAGNGGQIWFTELSENKIGSIASSVYNDNSNSHHQLPFSVSTTPQELTINRGRSVEIKVNVSTSSSFPPSSTINMVSSGTFSPTGDLGNSTGVFSEQSFPLEPSHSKNVYFIFTPARDLGIGNYTLMLGSENDAITIMKAIKLHIS
jgi:virginiamycin B lyase